MRVPTPAFSDEPQGRRRCAASARHRASARRIVRDRSSARLLAAAGQHPPVPVGDVAAFAQAMEWALAHPAQPRQLGEAVQGYRIEPALDAHLRAFARLVRGDGLRWSGAAQNSLLR